jgi:hypothetical protein
MYVLNWSEKKKGSENVDMKMGSGLGRHNAKDGMGNRKGFEYLWIVSLSNISLLGLISLIHS